MAKIVDTGPAKEQVNPESVRSVVIAVDDQGRLSAKGAEDFNVLELFHMSEWFYEIAKQNYFRNMEGQVYGLIKLLKEKKIILEGE